MVESGSCRTLHLSFFLFVEEEKELGSEVEVLVDVHDVGDVAFVELAVSGAFFDIGHFLLLDGLFHEDRGHLGHSLSHAIIVQ